MSGGPTSTDLKKREVAIPGPVDSPYEGGKFKVEINFPNKYSNGYVCVNILKKGTEKEKQNNEKIWTPKFSACKIILGLYGLLKKPNQTDP